MDYKTAMKFLRINFVWKYWFVNDIALLNAAKLLYMMIRIGFDTSRPLREKRKKKKRRKKERKKERKKKLKSNKKI